MVAIRSITSASAILTLTIPGLFPTPVPIQGFSTDTSFTEDALQTTEAIMGVDGHLSAGVVLHPTKMKISLQPDSESVTVFDAWAAAQKVSRSVFFADGVIRMPATGKGFTLTRGVLTSIKQVPDAKKVLQPQEYEITWESISLYGIGA